ncbi:hypothetical protein Pmani_013086 [Petrolisthes manimaculis]|uniref:Ionotropic glutamate receptor L-glutamate and glycine-binding domain-containing protein n=1 Tax=Petrolisthes manimaculis TaxID=1843537 RepID=A0AAE1PZL3_9EUCA|nr:hypothetical protein Pmani_013086 [Petrolisthes manimaculis]
MTRTTIVRLWIAGMSTRAISYYTGASVSTVYRWVRRWQKKAGITTGTRRHSWGRSCQYHPEDMRLLALLTLTVSTTLWLSVNTTGQLVLEKEEGMMNMNTLQVKGTMVDDVGIIVEQLVEQRFRSCHIILLSQPNPSPILNTVLRHIGDKVRNSVVVVTDGEQDLQQSIWGNTLTTCRVLIMCFNLHDNTTITDHIFSSLERAGLWKVHNTHVMMLGPRKGMETRLLQASLRVDERVRVYRRCLYCESGQPGVQFLFQWHLTWQHLDDFIQYVHLLDDPVRNLRGHIFRVVTIAYFPYIDYKRHREEPGTTVTPLDSLNVRILDTIADSLNFTYVMREDPNRSFGNIDADGNYNGMSGQLQREAADFSFSLAPTPGRLKVMDFIRFMPPDAFVVTTLRPSFLPANLALVRPFSSTVWVCVLSCVVGWGLVLWLLQALWTTLTGIRHGVTLDKALVYSWSALMENSAKQPSVNISGQMLVGWWLVFCLVVSTGFRSSLISHLTVQGRSRAPESFSDLVELETQGWGWGTETWTYDGAVLEYFSKHNHPVMKTLHNNMQVLGLREGMNKLLAGGFSFIMLKNYIMVAIQSYYTDTFGQSVVYVSKEEFSVMSCYGWGVRMGAPFFNSFINLRSRLEDAGLIEYWTESIMEDRVRSNRDKAKVDSDTSDTSQQLVIQDEKKEVVLSLSHLQGAFYLLALGVVMASLSLLGENLLGRSSEG